MFCTCCQEKWEKNGFKNFSDFSKKIRRVNQFDYGSFYGGDWYFADYKNLVIYSGDFGHTHLIGDVNRTFAEKYDNRNEFFIALKEWQNCPDHDYQRKEKEPSMADLESMSYWE